MWLRPQSSGEIVRPAPKYPNDPLPIAYDEGFAAKQQGKSEDDNPYNTSGHERDMTLDDELHYQWFSGYMDAPYL